jgi:hypothetical protein
VLEGQPVGPQVRGGLLILGVLLLIWEPLRTALAAGLALQNLHVRGVPMLVVLLLRVGVAGLSVAAASTIFRRAPHGLTLAAAALGAAAAVDLFAYLTPFFPNNRAPGDTPLYIAASLIYNGAWLTWVLRARKRSG